MSIAITVGIVILGVVFVLLQNWKYKQDQTLKDRILEIKKSSKTKITSLEGVD